MRNILCGWRVVGGILMAAAALVMSSCSSSSAPVKMAAAGPTRLHTLIDADWRFHRGDLGTNEAASAMGYDDQQWEKVELPHDYILDGSYSTNNARNHGYLPFMPAWYRKHLFIPESDQGKILQLEFGGIFRDSQVWLNGQFLGRHRSGYTTFLYDITKAARCGEENVITVRVDPTDFEGWWYEGGGIYRHVYLNALAPVHVSTWGTYVNSYVPNGNQGADGAAIILLQTSLENDGAMPANCTVVSEILGPGGAVLKTARTADALAANGHDQITQHAELARPRLWSPDSPNLYQLRTTILQDGQPVDSTTTTFGIRTIFYDAEKGFFLNGKHVEIHGVANHQDFPAVGIAVPDSLEPWRVRQLKKLGCNGWRTAHNPPNAEVLDACDHLGMLVMDENRHLGDSYVHHSPKGTTATNLADLADMIQRDRNHPSIIMWSMCNEETLQGTPEGAAIFTNMMAVVHRYDKTRPITSAMNAGYLTPYGDADVEDIIGVNYNTDRYDAIHKAHPGKPMFGSETANNKTARGVYELKDDKAKGWSSSYNLTDKGWIPVAERPFLAGMYTWTGFDYKGEPNPFGWPDVANNTGLVDSCGFPKDKGYYFKSWWSDAPMVRIMPGLWNWPGKVGKTIRVLAFSNARKMELFLNGKSLGVKTMPHDAHVEWQVPYHPGELVAKGYSNDRTIATDKVETVGPAARLQLSPDRLALKPGCQDTVVAPISIVDAQGRFVANAGNRVTFHLVGDAGKILGVGNGNPSDHDPDRASQRNAFNGRCIAVIQAGLKAGDFRLTATSPGLVPASVTFRVQ